MLKMKRFGLVMLALCASVATTVSPVRADPDLSTPKSAALSFANALVAGDSKGLRATSTGTEDQYKIVDALGAVVGSMKKLSDAASAKFGADNVITKSGKDMDIAAELENSEVKIDGDSATIIDKKKENDPNPMKLIKKDGKWVVDLNSLPKEGMDQITKIAPAMSKAAVETAAEIKADKFKTAEEAQQALGAKMLAAMMQAAPAPAPAPEK